MKPRYKLYCGVPEKDIGWRHWYKYAQPFEFGIAVNNMADVMKHKDIELPRIDNYSIQSSSGDWGFSVQYPI